MSRGFFIRAVLISLSGLCLLSVRAELGALPEFIVRQRMPGSKERRFDIYTPDKLLATALEHEDRDSRVFEVRDVKGGAFLIARVRHRPWGAEIFITDEKGKHLGSLKEKFFPGWIRMRTLWEVRDGKGALLSLSTKQDALLNELLLVDGRDGERVVLQRPALSLGDFWRARLSPKLLWDTRLVLALSLYRVASDAERRH